MTKLSTILSDAGSFILAIGLLLFYKTLPNYTPSGEYGQLIGVSLALIIAVLYVWLEASTVIRADTVSPVYFAWETFTSYVPAFAFMWLAAERWHGVITISPFQWVVGGIFLIVILLDLFGFVAMFAQRYLLTDELKTVR